MQKGDQFKLTDEAIENYGEQYRDQVFTVSHVADKYMPSDEFYKKGMPEGYHPGYDSGLEGENLYDAEELEFSVYDYEVIQV